MNNAAKDLLKFVFMITDKCEMFSMLPISVRGRSLVTTISVRQKYWWGHDTIEDQEERTNESKRKGLIAWTDPNKDLEIKKEYTWAPARIEQEALNSIGMTTGMLNHADVMKWIDRKFRKSMLVTWAFDYVEWREELRRREHKHLVL